MDNSQEILAGILFLIGWITFVFSSAISLLYNDARFAIILSFLAVALMILIGAILGEMPC